MPFDAMFLSAVLDELRPAVLGSRVEKIQQPARDMVVLQLRGRERRRTSAEVYSSAEAQTEAKPR